MTTIAIDSFHPDVDVPVVNLAPTLAEQSRALADGLLQLADELETREGEFLVMLVDPTSGDSTVACICETQEQAQQDAVNWLAASEGLLAFVVGA